MMYLKICILRGYSANCDFSCLSRCDSSRLQLQSQLAAKETLKNCRQHLLENFCRLREFLHVESVKEEKERATAC